MSVLASAPAGLNLHLSRIVKLVVVSPHRADAAFSLGLSIEHWLGAGHAVQVVNCFTRSEYAPFSDVGSLHPHDRASFASAVRRKEDVAWSKQMKGKFSIQDLDMMDAPLRLACGVDEVATVEIRPGDRAVARVTGAIEKAARGAQEVNAALAIPLSVGEHIDHRVVYRAAIGVLQTATLPFAFYEDLPYSARPGQEGAPETKAAEAGLDLQPAFAVAALKDPEIAVKRKRRVAECYDSQVDSAEVEQIAEFSLRYAGRERVWGSPAWLESALCTRENEPA